MTRYVRLCFVRISPRQAVTSTCQQYQIMLRDEIVRRQFGALICMLEAIGTPGVETISTPNRDAISICEDMLAAGVQYPVVAEIGVGIGATTVEIARVLANRGEIHIYDFESRVIALKNDLLKLGFTNVKAFGNSNKHWDSYNWQLAKLLKDGKRQIYDYIYIDGAHTFMVDGLTFVLCDRLIKPGGYLDFDDYHWSFSRSRWMKDVRHEYMTQEQIEAQQVAMVVDLLVKNDSTYEEIKPKKLFRKRIT